MFFSLAARALGNVRSCNLKKRKKLSSPAAWSFLYLVPVVRTPDNAIQRINYYPADSVVCFVNTYSLDSDLSSGWRYPPFEQPGSGAHFSKVPKSFRTWKAVAKSRTLWFQGCSIRVVLTWREVFFIQEVSSIYTSPVLDTDELNGSTGPKSFRGFRETGPYMFSLHWHMLETFYWG